MQAESDRVVVQVDGEGVYPMVPVGRVGETSLWNRLPGSIAGNRGRTRSILALPLVLSAMAHPIQYSYMTFPGSLSRPA